MSMAWHELPLFFRREGADLFGVVTRPNGASRDVGVLVAWGAGPYPCSGRNQIRTRLARRLAEQGFHVLRFDYAGVGESSGRARPVRFDRPWTSDVVAACDALRAEGVSRVVLVGNCFGGRNVLASAPRISGLVGVALIGAPVLDLDHTETLARDRSLAWHAKRALSSRTVKQLGSQRKRRRYARILVSKAGDTLRRLAGGRTKGAAQAGRLVVRPLSSLVCRRIPVLFAYSTADPAWVGFQEARSGRLGRVLDAAGGLVTVHRIEAGVGDLQTQVELQQRVIDSMGDWLDRTLPAGSRESETNEFRPVLRPA